MSNEIKKLFLLDPHIHFLNHGSFGACPIPVFQEYQKWQMSLENQPVEFLGREINAHMGKAREKLAEYVNCQPDELVYFPNPTTAINMVARNLTLQPGDEILATNHEYGAMDRTWRFITKKTGAKYINHPIPLPLTTKEEFIEEFWAGVTEKTKVIFLSHISSPTALIFPVEEVCRRARSLGIFSIVDGAHVPGQIPLNLENIGADLYTGACHKWLCAPKGSAFLFARKEVQTLLDPLIISWGYQAEELGHSQFIDYHEWQGTKDMSAFLSVQAAIEFQTNYKWDVVRKKCYELLLSA
jgi:isopenicillin-N epimerase